MSPISPLSMIFSACGRTGYSAGRGTRPRGGPGVSPGRAVPGLLSAFWRWVFPAGRYSPVPGPFYRGVMVVILRADDGDVRQARLRQQDSASGNRRTEARSSSGAKSRTASARSFTGFAAAQCGNGPSVPWPAPCGPGAGTAADAGEGESFCPGMSVTDGGRFKECRI